MTPGSSSEFWLEIAAGEIKGKAIVLATGLTVGRQEDCDLVLPNDPLVSRKHARFYLEDNCWWVENLGSLNGIYVNKTQILRRQALSPGDHIIIGNHLLVLNYQNLPASLVNAPAEDALRPATPGHAPDALRRLALMNQLNRAAANSNSVPEILRLVLSIIFQDLRVERGCIFMLDPQTGELKPVCYKIRGRDDSQSLFQPFPSILSLVAIEQSLFTVDKKQLQGSGLSLVIGLPLLENKHLVGFIYLDSSSPDFSLLRADSEFLESLGHLASISLAKVTLESHHRSDQELLTRLEKHVGPEILRLAREKKVDLNSSMFETQEKEVTILFSDIKGFTSLSETLAPAEIAFLLNGYFNHMADCVARHHGYLNKYIGDAVMAVFGAPYSMGNDAENAIRCAIDMLAKLQLYWKSIDEKKRFQIRIGINTGLVTAGNIGSNSRMEYTVIGDDVNLASRLESNAEPMSILIGEATYQKVAGLFPLQQLDSLKVKGKAEPVHVYKVLVSAAL